MKKFVALVGAAVGLVLALKRKPRGNSREVWSQATDQQ